MRCLYCQKECIKKGKRKSIQKYQCKACGKYQQKSYVRSRIPEEKYRIVSQLQNEGCGISSISRLLGMSQSSVLRILRKQKEEVKKPVFDETNESYEIDEIKTFCGSKQKETWLIYAINRKSKQVIDFFVGRRTKENIKKVVDSVLALKPKHIYTDKLNIYGRLLNIV